MNKTEIFHILNEQKATFKSQFNILKIGFFGSYAMGTYTSKSDLDLIFELEEGKHLGLKEMYDLEQFTKKLFKIDRIDLVNHKYMNPIINAEVEKTVIYV